MKSKRSKSNNIIKAFWLGFILGVATALLANITFSCVIADLEAEHKVEECGKQSRNN